MLTTAMLPLTFALMVAEDPATVVALCCPLFGTLWLSSLFLAILFWVALFPYPDGGVDTVGFGFILPLVAIVLTLIALILSRRAQAITKAKHRKARDAHTAPAGATVVVDAA